MTAPVRNLYASTVPAIEVAGQRPYALQRDLLDLRVCADRSGPRRLRLRLSAAPTGAAGDAQDLLYLDRRLLDFGKEIKVFIGPAEGQALAFEGRISRIDAQFVQGQPAAVEVHAEDRLFDLATTRHTRTYERASVGDLVQAVAGRHGMAADVSVGGPVLPLVQQWNETDLGFLVSRLDALDADLWVDAGRLHAAPRDERRPNRLTLHAGAELQALQLSADLGGQRSEIAVGGYDQAQRAAVDETGSAADLGAQTRGGTSGIDLLASAFSARPSARRLMAVTTTDEARDLARAALRARARRFVNVSAVATVLPDLTIGTRLCLDGIGPMFGGDGYGVTEVAHGFDRTQGATTAFRAERATVDGGN
jgi:phage protein D